jgi:hypothetical protein
MTTKVLADRADLMPDGAGAPGGVPSALGRGRPTLVEAQAAVRAFLREALPDVHRIDITKVMSIEFNEAGWEADAVVWQPNPTIQALGLSTERPVLDQNFYLVRLDGRLNVIGYEIKEVERSS